MSTLSHAQPPSGGSPDVPNSRRKHPCVLCQQRKVKCDRNEPCANCTKARVECISPSSLPPKKRKKRFPEAELLARLRRYEDHLRAYGADIDAINSGGIVSLPVPAKSPGLEVPVAAVEEPNPQPIRSLSIRHALKHTKHTMWTGVNEEVSHAEEFFRDAEEILQGSSGDEQYETPITKTYDAIDQDGGDLLFSTPSTESMIDLHPSTVQIFRLWQTFLDNVNPIIKIFHAPTVQQQILDATSDLSNVSKPMEALMFGIYATAVTSLSDLECKNMFGEEKTVLRGRYSAGSRQALRNAGVLRTSNLVILQAFVLYLTSCLNFHIDPRALFCLTGIAVRIALRMGLSFDGTSYGLQPFEIEMRRRLWWQIILLDFRVAELSGAGCAILTTVWTTKLPLNVNDSDLFPDMRDPPPEHPGITEMVYVLQRCEITALFQKLRNSPESIAYKDKAIDELARHIEDRYLKFCDPSIPLHILSTFMARTGIAKLHMGPRHPHLLSTSSLHSEEKDSLFRLSLSMMQNHNQLMTSTAIKHFFWHCVINFPFPAHIYLLCSLRTRPNDEWADRAWDTVLDFFKLRMMLWDRHEHTKPKESALHAAMSNLTMKAWDAREKANPGIVMPELIAKFRDQYLAKKSPKEPKDEQTPPQQASVVNYTDPFTDSFSWMNQPNMGFGPGEGDPMMMQGTENTTSMGMGWEFWNDLMPVNGPVQGYGVGNGLNGMYST